MKHYVATLILLMSVLLGLSACGAVATPAGDSGGSSGENPTAVPDTTPEPADEPTLVAASTSTPNVTEAVPEATVPASPTESATTVAINTSVPESTPPPNTPEPAPTEGAEVPDGAIMVFRRDGGIAGFCDTMTITASLVTLESCNPNSAQGEMPLDPAVRDRLFALQEQYGPITVSETDAPGAADAMTLTIEFAGTGSEPLTAEAQDELMTIGRTLLDNFASQS